jgi:hypothetical protein
MGDRRRHSRRPARLSPSPLQTERLRKGVSIKRTATRMNAEINGVAGERGKAAATTMEAEKTTPRKLSVSRRGPLSMIKPSVCVRLRRAGACGELRVVMFAPCSVLGRLGWGGTKRQMGSQGMTTSRTGTAVVRVAT